MIEKNAHNLYQKQDSRSISLTGDEISPEKLEALVASASALMPQHLQNHFARRIQIHVGAESTYKFKTSVLQSLRVIHDQFMDPKTSLSEKKIIAFKLEERAAQCSPGFHNGVNAIVEGFYLPKSIPDLLSQVRRDIVYRVASKLTDEVHTNNRVFVLAEAYGYGVFALNKEDVYRGDLSDETIRSALEEAFSFEENLFPILMGFEEQLSGFLNQVGIDSGMTGGYSSDDCAQMDACFKTLFEHESVVIALQEAARASNQANEMKHNIKMQMQTFIQGHPEHFTELNKHLNLKVSTLLNESGIPLMFKSWSENALENLPADKLETFKAIVSQYTAQITSLGEAKARERDADERYREAFYVKNEQTIVRINWANIRQMLWLFIKQENFFTFTNEEDKPIDALLACNTNETAAITAFTRLLNASEKGNDFVQVIHYFFTTGRINEAQILEYVRDNPIRYEQFYAVVHKLTDLGIRNKIIETHWPSFEADFKHDESTIAPVMAFMTAQKARDFLVRDDIIQFSLLNRVISSHPESLPTLFMFIKTLPEPPKVKLLTLFFSNKDNPNMGIHYFIFHTLYVIPHLIESLKTLPEPIITQLLSDVLSEQDNPLMRAFITGTLKSGLAIRLLMEIMELLPAPNRADWVTRALTQKNPEDNSSLLVLAAQFNPPVISHLMEAMLTLPDATKNHSITLIWTEQNNSGRNALMTAIQSNPSAILPLTEAMKMLPDTIQDDLITRIWTEKNDSGRNALMTAIQSNPSAILPLTEAMKMLPDTIQDNLITQIWTERSNYGSNALVIAILSNPPAILELMEAMNRLPNTVRDDVITRVFLEQNQDGNALMIAVKSHPSALPSLLDAMKTLPESIRSHVVEQCFKAKINVNAYNRSMRREDVDVLDLALQHDPSSIPLLVDFIAHAFPESISDEMLIQIFVNESSYQDYFGKLQTRNRIQKAILFSPSVRSESAVKLIEAMTTLPNTIRVHVIENIFRQKLSNDKLLSLEVNIFQIINAIEQVLPEESKENVLSRIFTEQHFKEKSNLLTLAASGYNENALLNCIQAMATLPKNILAQVMVQALTEKNKSGYNAIMHISQSSEKLRLFMEGLRSVPHDMKEDVITRVFMSANALGKTDISALFSQINRFGDPTTRRHHLFEQNRSIDAFLQGYLALAIPIPLKILLDGKSELVDYSALSPERLKITLNCLATMPVNNQKTFYQSLLFSHSELKQHARREVHIQNILNRLEDISNADENSGDISAVYHDLKNKFEAYQQTTRTAENAMNLYQDIDQALDNPLIQRAFLHSGAAQPHRPPFFKPAKNINVKIMEKFKQDFEKLRAADHGVHLDQRDDLLP